MKKNFFRGKNAIFDFINPENHYTPLVEINERINELKEKGVNIFAKLSWFNPLLNIKAIPAYWMLKRAKEDGKLDGVKNLIEASSGNMAYSIKILSSYFGIKNFIALVSNQVTDGKRKLMDLMGIRYKIRQEDICPDPDDPNSSINVAKRFRNKKGWNNLGQYDNENNYWGHYNITAKQIYDQLEGDIDIISIGLGTTGTLIGVSKYLKERIKNLTVIGVIRHKNNLVPGVRTLNLLKQISFKWEEYVDYKIFMDTKSSYYYSLLLIREGLFCGPSSGFALAGLINFLKNNLDKFKYILDKKGYINCVFISPDTFLPYIDNYFEVLKLDKENSTIIEEQNLDIESFKNEELAIPADRLNEIINSEEKKDWLIIDIRNEVRFKDAHLEGSINIPYKHLKEDNRFDIFNSSKKNIVLVCDYGVKAEFLAGYLKKKYPHVNFYYLEGGISEWSIRNYPRKGNVCFK